MVLCGNICFSGFYSDDFHVQGAEWGERLSKRSRRVADFENSRGVRRSVGDVARP